MFRQRTRIREPESGDPMMSWWWESMSLYKDSNMSGLLPMLKPLKDRQDNIGWTKSLRIPYSLVANISVPNRNCVPYGNTSSKIQGALSSPGKILSASPLLGAPLSTYLGRYL
jgi:hypothetical protein